MTRFRNPSNGYEENVGEAWLWCLLAGPIYFAAKGIWLHAATSLLLAIGTSGISWFIYPFFAFREIAQTVGEAEFRTLMLGPAKRAVEGIDHLS